MKKSSLIGVLLLGTSLVFGQSAKKLKGEVIANVEAEKANLIEVSDKI